MGRRQLGHRRRANDAPHLADGLLGRSLWEFIDGKTTRQVYRHLLVRVRSGLVVRFPFRFDSPMEACTMLMTMRPGGAGVVEFSTLTSAVGPPATHRLATTPDLIRMCSWCRRVWADGGWCYPEYAIDRIGLFERPHAQLTHGLCDRCEDTLSVNVPDIRASLSPPDDEGQL